MMDPRLKWCVLGPALLALAFLFAAPACDDGGGGPECTPGKEPMPGCGISDCQAGHNTCQGTVYGCDATSHVIELGVCDPSPHNIDAGGSCQPGVDPVPGCGQFDCQFGGACGGQFFVCDMSGHVLAFPCEMGGVVDAAVPAPDAAEPSPDADLGSVDASPPDAAPPELP